MEKYRAEKVVFSSVKQKKKNEEMDTDPESERNTTPTRTFFLVSLVPIHIVTSVV